MHTHRFPQPMWNMSGKTITFDEKMANQLSVKQCEPLGIVYVPNNPVYDLLTNSGRSPIWAAKAPFVEYPKAMHGPDMQCITVYNREEEDAAFANGWSHKPLIEEKPLELPPSPFRAPKMTAVAVEEPEPVKRGPGRPKAS